MRRFRVRLSNLDKIADLNPKVVPFRTDYNFDSKHSGFTFDGEKMVTVELNMSGRKFHRLLKDRGLLPKFVSETN